MSLFLDEQAKAKKKLSDLPTVTQIDYEPSPELSGWEWAAPTFQHRTLPQNFLHHHHLALPCPALRTLRQSLRNNQHGILILSEFQHIARAPSSCVIITTSTLIKPFNLGLRSSS